MVKGAIYGVCLLICVSFVYESRLCVVVVVLVVRWNSGVLVKMVRWGCCRWRFVGIVVMLFIVTRHCWCTTLILDLELLFFYFLWCLDRGG